MDFDRDSIIRELDFKTSRAGGRGGQHVNKVSSKVLLSWRFWESEGVNLQQKELIAERLASRITKQDVLQLEISEDRSQLRNRKLAVERLIDLLHQKLKPHTPRIKTKTPRSVILARLDHKKKTSQKKDQRRWRYKGDS